MSSASIFLLTIVGFTVTANLFRGHMVGKTAAILIAVTILMGIFGGFDALFLR